MATKDQRDHLHALMKYLISKEPQIFWAEIRAMKNIHWYEQQLVDWFSNKGHTITMDCSESYTLLCKLAGLQDPNGFGYNGQGYTGTLLNHLPHYSDAKDADVGAGVVFGPGTGEHVAMVMEPGPDPWLFSHGQNAGPIKIRLSQERQYHKPPVTFLSIAGL